MTPDTASNVATAAIATSAVAPATRTYAVPPKTILVGTDFGAPSAEALTYAISLARTFKAKVHVVHVFELPILGTPDGTLGITPDVVSRIVEGAELAMELLAKRHDRAKSGVELITTIEKCDHPREGILAIAEREEADLIILGTHGRQGLARALIGSVAEGVIRRSTIPVLTVHASLATYAAATATTKGE